MLKKIIIENQLYKPIRRSITRVIIIFGIIDVILIIFIWENLNNNQFLVYQNSSRINSISAVNQHNLPPTLTPTLSPVLPSPAPTSIPTPPKKQSSTKISASDELFAAMNNYRASHNVQLLAKDEMICTIVQKRATDLQNMGKLDDHDGFRGYKEDLTKNYHSTGEVLYFGTSADGTQAIEFGWDRSPRHREIIQNSAFNRGCGALTTNVAVFIFAEN